MNLRPYQQECVEEVERRGAGRWLIQMACGLGKTVVMSSLPRVGRTLILAHREELLRQAASYYDCPVGMIKAGECESGEDVVVATVQTMCRRVLDYPPDTFDTVHIDECHRSAARTYKKIMEHLRPRRLLGWTATPNRSDGKGLHDLFDDIVFERDIRWGIRSGWLCPVEARTINIGYDLRHVVSRMGDLAIGGLSRALNIRSANNAIAEAVAKHASYPVLIFAVDVAHAQALAEVIPNSLAMHGASKDRKQIAKAFRDGKIPVLINCQLYTEGTDFPNVRTIVMARPTESETLYIQMAGRVMRPCEGKSRGLILDLVGNAGKHTLCNSATLIGMDIDSVPTAQQENICGDLLLDLPELITNASDNLETWIKNVKVVNLWAKRRKIKTHSINFFKCPDGSLMVLMQGRRWVRITCPDLLGRASLLTSIRVSPRRLLPLQKAMDQCYLMLSKYYSDQEHIWNLKIARRWGRRPASEKQKQLIEAMSNGEITPDYFTKLEASNVLNRLFWKR